MGTSSQEWKLSNMTPSSSDYFILSFSSSLFPSASGSLNQQNETPSCLTHSFLLSFWPEWFRQGHTPSPAEAPLMDKHRKESKNTHTKKSQDIWKDRTVQKRGDHRFLPIKLSYWTKISQDCSFRSSEGNRNCDFHFQRPAWADLFHSFSSQNLIMTTFKKERKEELYQC